MPIDGITLHLLIDELKKEIIGSRIDKIHQPASEEFIFHLRSRNGIKKLVINSSSNMPHMNLTDKSPENPPAPPMICMFLRKHLTGCLIEDISQQGFDRIARFKLSGRNEIGDPVKYSIIFEAMPKYANFIILNEDGIIIESLKKSDYSPAADRAVLPGFKYKLPPMQNKLDPLSTDTEILFNAVKSEKGKLLSQAVLCNIEGISPLISREIASLVTGGDKPVSELSDSQTESLKQKIERFKDIVNSGGVPTLLKKSDGTLFDISFTDITQYGFSIISESFATFSALIDYYCSSKNANERSGQQSRELQKTLTNLISRSNRKLLTRRQEFEKCADKDKYRIFAELILAHQYSLEKGAAFYDVTDYYNDNEPLRIPADPALNPPGNAKKYFKEYNKLKNAEKLLGDLISESEAETEYLESVLDSVRRAEGFSDIAQIKTELIEQGYIKKKSGKKIQTQKQLPPIEYISDDGYRILVGRNNIQNEQLSFKTADKSDSWFHTQKYPGSHVVVIGNGDILPELTCRQAAIIAAYNSSARDSSQVAVDYTEARELKRPSGGKPGKVIYHTYNTMWVTPDRELCERLKKK